jgi:hypothetical protein
MKPHNLPVQIVNSFAVGTRGEVTDLRNLSDLQTYEARIYDPNSGKLSARFDESCKETLTAQLKGYSGHKILLRPLRNKKPIENKKRPIERVSKTDILDAIASGELSGGVR